MISVKQKHFSHILNLMRASTQAGVSVKLKAFFTHPEINACFARRWESV